MRRSEACLLAQGAEDACEAGLRIPLRPLGGTGLSRTRRDGCSSDPGAGLWGVRCSGYK